jgi:hypothetical protein
VSSILDRIDATLDGLCPCGADPQPGSAYCSYDCEPNWRGLDTISDVDRTAMRWRPDLVTAVDDSDLSLIAEFPVRGRWGRIFERAGSDTLHLRLDDGHRFVGTDVAADQAGPPDIEPGLRAELDPIWDRLDRELGDARRVVGHPRADPDAYLLNRLIPDPSAVTSFAEAMRESAQAMAVRLNAALEQIIIAPVVARANEARRELGYNGSAVMSFDFDNARFRSDWARVYAMMAVPPPQLGIHGITGI